MASTRTSPFAAHGTKRIALCTTYVLVAIQGTQTSFTTPPTSRTTIVEELILKQRRTRPAPSYRRRTRNAEGELVYNLENGMSFHKYQRLIGNPLSS
jgi:hypothetical protein